MNQNHHNTLADPKPLGFNEYQAKAIKTAIYPEKGTGSPLALAYVGLGLGEAGEVQGKIKKVLRDNAGMLTFESRKAIRSEVGDVLWYLAAVAEECGFTLGEAARENLFKLSDRHERGVIGGSGDER